MFKKDAFCNVASNNRTNKQSAIFIYKTTDDIATVTATDYFVDKIVDLQLHDIIVHEKINAADQTNVTWNLLSITSRTLTSVKATLLETGLENRVTALETAQTALTARVTTIEGKIPTQASAENQLADKNFVNSSIQGQTAAFDGNWNTYASVPTTVAGFTALGLPEPSINNYLVITADETHSNETWRYKYTGELGATYDKTKWFAEYKLNDTAFTAAQLAAINSNITSELVARIESNPVIITDMQLTASTGAITITTNKKPTTKTVKTLVGGTAITGTWIGTTTSWTFTPTTASSVIGNDVIVTVA